MKKSFLLFLLLTFTVAATVVTAWGDKWANTYYQYDYPGARVAGVPDKPWYMTVGYFDDNDMWYASETESGYVEAPDPTCTVTVTQSDEPIELTGDFADLHIEGADVTIYGNVEGLTLGYGLPEYGGTEPSTVTVYGDVRWLSVAPEFLNAADLYVTGDVGYGSVTYNRYTGVTEYFDFGHKGDGETLVKVVEDGRTLVPMFPVRTEKDLYGEPVGRTLADSGVIGVTLPSPETLAGGTGSIELSEVDLTAEQKEQIAQYGEQAGCDYVEINSFAVTLRDMMTGEPLPQLEEPSTIRFDVPDAYRKDGREFTVFLFSDYKDEGFEGQEMTQMGSFISDAGGLDVLLDRSGTYVIAHNGGDTVKMAIYVGGGVIAVLLIGGMIAVNIVKKKEKAAEEGR